MINNKRKNRGFSLIELMIAIAIVGIISAIAYPSYTSYMQRTRRAQAEADLTQLANFMERFYGENFKYNVDSSGKVWMNTTRLPFMTSPSSDTVNNGVRNGKQYYNIDFIHLGANHFTLMARPVKNQANDKCGKLTIDQTGTKGIDSAAAGVTAADCWQ